MSQEYFKGVVWPRETMVEPGKKNYRYIIVGMLLSDKPIPELDQGTGKDIYAGEVVGLGKILATVPRREAKYQYGDAVSVLCGLEDL